MRTASQFFALRGLRVDFVSCVDSGCVDSDGIMFVDIADHHIKLDWIA